MSEVNGNIEVKKNEDVIARFPVPKYCDTPQGWTEVDIIQNKMKVCTFTKQDSPKVVYEQKCEYTIFETK